MTSEGFVEIIGKEREKIHLQYQYLKQTPNQYIFTEMEPIEENVLIIRQQQRYGCSFWTSPNGECTVQVPKHPEDAYKQIQNLKSCGYTINQEKR